MFVHNGYIFQKGNPKQCKKMYKYISMPDEKWLWNARDKSKNQSLKVVMDLEQISPNLSSFFILLGKIRGERARWRHFYAIKVFNIIATVVFFVLGVFLIVAYIINKGVEEELKEAANFDKWSPFILSSGSDFV